MVAKMRNMGEACTSANRFHIADAVAEQFADKLAAKMGAMKLGRAELVRELLDGATFKDGIKVTDDETTTDERVAA